MHAGPVLTGYGPRKEGDKMTREDIKGGLLILTAVLLGSCIDGIVNAICTAMGF